MLAVDHVSDARAAQVVVPPLSDELFTIPLDADRYIVYGPLRRAAFVANARTVNLLANLQAGRYESEADPDGSLLDFLRQLEIVDGCPEGSPITIFGGEPEPTLVSLFLTTACNLRCTYCYASAGETPARFMSLEVAQRGIDFVAGNAVKKGVGEIEIIYHGGGEPTVNWRTMTDSLAHARQRGAELGLGVRAYTATNGVLADHQVEWIVENLAGASVSFDGLPEVHDANRLTVLGSGSSERVMSTLRRFDAAGFSYGLRVTVTADQIPKLADSIEFICASFRPRRVQVEPAYQLGRWSEAPTAETDDFIAAYREAQARARHYGREISYSAARLGVLTNHFCGASQDSFALSPDGNVSACYEAFAEDSPLAPTFFYGRPASDGRGYSFDLPVLSNLRRQGVQQRDWCQGCFAKWSCAGDCYHKALTVNGSGEFRGSDRCHITRELTKDQILAKIVASGGLFWHEPRAKALPGGQEKGEELVL